MVNAHSPERQRGVVWKVVGGVGKGGIKVRTEKELSSPEAPARLSTGALVVELEQDAGRLNYRMITGTGPARGWVSVGVDGKVLLEKTDDTIQVARDEGRAKPKANKVAVKAKSTAEIYAKRFSQVEDEEEADGIDAQADAKPQTQPKRRFRSHLASRVAQTPEKPKKLMSPSNFFTGKQISRMNVAGSDAQLEQPAEVVWFAEDSDGEEQFMCSACGLPVGGKSCQMKDGLLHAECMAHLMVHEANEQDRARQQKEAELKKARRAEFGIGWKAERIPRSAGHADKMGGLAPHSMYCLVLKDPAGPQQRVELAATVEPAAAINLEYLSLALQVRRDEGCEPSFSLDPVEKALSKEVRKQQLKKYEPEWLEGTSLGEVMFQADYHLKELSMGEVEQPIIGMKSCLDLSWHGEKKEEWCGREWFTVQKAEVQLSEDRVLIPHVKLGVEAREQYLGLSGLIDKKITEADHPLVKYADDFTHFFDLIAERKSVINQLREVAKACVLAKYLTEANIELDDTWFDLANDSSSIPTGPRVIPQLWNERFSTKISVKDGEIEAVDPESDVSVAIYGGVEMKLPPQPFQAVAVPAAPGMDAPDPTTGQGMAMAAAGAGPGAGRPGFGGGGPRRRMQWRGRPRGMKLATPLRDLLPKAPVKRPKRGAPQMLTSAVKSPGIFTSGIMATKGTMGVDLNLDSFNLSKYKLVPVNALEASDRSWGCCLQPAEGLSTASAIASNFWSSVDGSRGFGFADESRRLLKQVFNSHLSDRREEADSFIPPKTNFEYVQNLADLLADEEEVCQLQREYFLSPDFDMSQPGVLYPSSWTSNKLELVSESTSQGLRPCQDYTVSDSDLNKTTCIFDKVTEDATRFRIYRLGSLEVRVVHESGGEESERAVFSRAAGLDEQSPPKSLQDTETIRKVTAYVSRIAEGAQSLRYYVVLETSVGNVIVTEMSKDGMTTWEENPASLEDRNSLAKVLHSENFCSTKVTVQQLRFHQAAEARDTGCRVSGSTCKRYAQGVYCFAAGSSWKLSQEHVNIMHAAC
mmetsp:Transcript_7921/g.14917  ORF Transcript_7921/g.14917 Transcript_7921/m.14917 type:complete len:1036 (-) Transcript_7921:84-3191(-)